MRLANRLRELRGSRPLREIAADTGLSPSDLSRLERGVWLPRDDQVDALEAAYGMPVVHWFLSPYTLLAVERDEPEAV